MNPRRFDQPLRKSARLLAACATVAASALLLQACQAPVAEVSPKQTAPKVKAADKSGVNDGITVDVKSVSEQLLQAAAKGDAQAVRKQLSQGASVNTRDAQGNTPLLLATAGNHIEVARSLLLDGANPNLKNAQNDSAYLLAGAQGRLEIVRMTLSYGADLKSTNRYGGTALIPACERGHVETAKALMEAGVDLNHVNNLGWTCLLEAIVLSDGGPNHQVIVRELIARGADLNLADKQGVTPLAHARQRGQKEMVQLLQAAGAR